MAGILTFIGWECKARLVYYNFAEESAVPTVNFSLHVASSLSWQVFYRGMEVSNSLLSSKACIGNSDKRFLHLISLRDGVFHDHTGMLILYALITKPLYYTIMLSHTFFPLLQFVMASVSCSAPPQVSVVLGAPHIATRCVEIQVNRLRGLQLLPAVIQVVAPITGFYPRTS